MVFEEVVNTFKENYERTLKHSVVSVTLAFHSSNQTQVMRNDNTIVTVLDFSTSNSFNKIFNRNTVKISYCRTENVGNIKSHNNKLLGFVRKLRGNAELKNIIYKYIVSTSVTLIKCV